MISVVKLMSSYEVLWHSRDSASISSFIVFSLSLFRKDEAPVTPVFGSDSCAIKHTSTVNSNGEFCMHSLHSRKSMVPGISYWHHGVRLLMG